MNFKIVFDNSGDFLPFYAVRPEVLDYYVDQLTQRNLNKFHDHTHSTGKDIAKKISTLHSSITQVNAWAGEILGNTINEFTDEEYLNQYNLNKLHEYYVWVKQNLTYNIGQKRKDYNFTGYAEKLHNMFPDNIQNPSITTVLDKLDLDKSFTKINTDLHVIETSFNILKFSVKDVSWVEFKNPFSTAVLNNNISNFRLGFNHVGRSLYNKYCNFDLDLEFNDENSFNELVNMVEISLSSPQTVLLSQEYVDWCNLHNKVPSGNYLNIGNIPDLDKKLHDYRLIIFRNLIANSSFSIHLN